MGVFDTVDELAVTPGRARVHEAGWQSWSPTDTYPLSERPPRPQHDWQQVMRFRPGSPPPESGFQSEGVLALSDDGARTRLYTPVDTGDGVDEVPTIRVQHTAGRVVVSADGPVQAADVEGGIDDALVAFGDRWAQRCGVRSITAPPSVWCSWYHYFLEVAPADIEENLAAMDRLDLPVDVVQVDDGWQSGIGDWDAYSERFRALPDLVARIRDRGRRAGIWVAPLTVGSRSRLAREHPEWLVGEGGRNWDQSLRGLDVTHPAAAAHLQASLRALHDLGIDYVKLDFLYTGALPGRRHEDVTPVAAYRRGLALVREALGDDTYLLGCGAPLLPSVGVVDAMRVSADVLNPEDDEPGLARLRGERAIVARAWQQGRFWVDDPDCLVARPGFELRHRWADLIDAFGGLRSASDRIQDLDDWGVRTTRRLLSTAPPPSPFGPRVGGPTR
ncbi:MAG: glycoside hydrolase family 36 protein [Lapillicoccus sp.]